MARLVELHLRAFGFSEQGWTDSAVRRFVRDAGPLLPRLMRLIRADVTSQNRRKVARLQAGNDELARRIVELAEREALDAIRPDIDGSRIMEILGLEPGRLVGQARDFLLELRLEEGPSARPRPSAACWRGGPNGTATPQPARRPVRMG